MSSGAIIRNFLFACSTILVGYGPYFLWWMGPVEWSVEQFNDLFDGTFLAPSMLWSCLVGIDASWTVGEPQSSGTTLYLIMQLLLVCNRFPGLLSGMLTEGHPKITLFIDIRWERLLVGFLFYCRSAFCVFKDVDSGIYAIVYLGPYTHPGCVGLEQSWKPISNGTSLTLVDWNYCL